MLTFSLGPLTYLFVQRYSIQRFARKIRGRVLGEQNRIRPLIRSPRSSLIAVNYRLAPQYPFPCAIQDLLAACEPCGTLFYLTQS